MMLIAVCVIGGPGSGKSSLCSLLKQRYDPCCTSDSNSDSNSNNKVTDKPLIRISHHVSFDDVEAAFERDRWDESTFADFRKENFKRIESILQSYSSSNGSSNNDKAPAGDSAVDVILIDDIMYLHSMRRELYVLCREYGCTVGFVHAQVSNLDIAVQRNNSRPAHKRVDGESALRIHSRFERLDAKLVSERGSLETHMDTAADLERSLEASYLFIGALVNQAKGSTALKGRREAKSEVSAGPLSDTALLDLQLRKVVSHLMKRYASRSSDGSRRSELSRLLSSSKADLLALAGRAPGGGECPFASNAVERFASLLTLALESSEALRGDRDFLVSCLEDYI